MSNVNTIVVNVPVCAFEGCSEAAYKRYDNVKGEFVGSKYCQKHKSVARENFKAMLDDQAKAKAKRDAANEALHAKAMAEAAKGMDLSAKGPKGEAWVTIRGNASFGHWLRNHADNVKYSDGSDGQHKGIRFAMPLPKASLMQKAAAAENYASVLRADGVKVTTGQRIEL